MTSYPKYLRWKIAVRNKEVARIMAEDYRRRIIEGRNACIVMACLDGGLALGAAALVDIHIAFALIGIAAVFAQMAVYGHRRADAIRPRADAADLAETGDVAWAEAA